MTIQQANAQQNIEIYGIKYYQNLKKVCFPTTFSNLIELDVTRTQIDKKDDESTFSSNSLSKLNGINLHYNQKQRHQNLKEILQLYSIRNSNIGYCQGINFIVNFLLENNYTNEETFWILTNLLENVLPLDYYISLQTLLADQAILKNMINQQLPKISKFFNKIQLDIQIVSIRWFLCLFTASSLPNNIKQVIWDFLLLEGNIALFKSVLVILKLLKTQIFKAKDFVDGIKIIESSLDSIDDPQLFIKNMKQIKINEKLLEIFRIKVKKDQEEQKKKNEKQRNINRKKREKVLICDKEYPICVFKLNQLSDIESFIFQDETFIFNQIDMNHINTMSPTNLHNPSSPPNESVMMVRQQHTCQVKKDSLNSQWNQQKSKASASQMSPQLFSQQSRFMCTLPQSTPHKRRCKSQEYHIKSVIYQRKSEEYIHQESSQPLITEPESTQTNNNDELINMTIDQIDSCTMMRLERTQSYAFFKNLTVFDKSEQSERIENTNLYTIS